jgi:hypothetical protein
MDSPCIYAKHVPLSTIWNDILSSIFQIVFSVF